MYVCVCNAVTERQVRATVAAGAVTLSDLSFELGVASCCGCCAETASQYLPGGCSAAEQEACAAARPGSDATHGFPLPVVVIAEAA